MIKKSLLTPIIILFLVGSASILVFAASQDKKENILILEKDLNWKAYENVEYHLFFRYPPESSVEELSNLAPDYLQVNLLEKGQKARAIIMVRGDYEPEDASDFVGARPEEEKNINGQSWYFFDFPQGFSNSPPFTVYQNEGAGFLYSFKFYNAVSNKLRDAIMATFIRVP